MRNETIKQLEQAQIELIRTNSKLQKNAIIIELVLTTMAVVTILFI